MLELKDICYSVRENGDDLDIINHISLTIPDGSLIVFTGPNGGGKTTLAKIIMGLVNPTSGRILLDGEDITGKDITERAR
ncbi:MAG: ATP-binding cassette domain-containing protein, partial [Oscillospiraceae bacterium]|nr:ATP-binding cassette domain-containing protein [Oscillospiraceae bacterium]